MVPQTREHSASRPMKEVNASGPQLVQAAASFAGHITFSGRSFDAVLRAAAHQNCGPQLFRVAGFVGRSFSGFSFCGPVLLRALRFS